MVITDIQTQSEILSEMVKELTINFTKDEKNDFNRKHFDAVIARKFNQGRFPIMNVKIINQ